jgi:hypothetical protein
MIDGHDPVDPIMIGKVRSIIKRVNRNRVLMEAGIDVDPVDPSDLILAIMMAGVRAIQKNGLVGVDDDSITELRDTLLIASENHVDPASILESIGSGVQGAAHDHKEDLVDATNLVNDSSSLTHEVENDGNDRDCEVKADLLSWDPVFCTATIRFDHDVPIACGLSDNGLLFKADAGQTVVKIKTVRMSIDSDGKIDEAFATSKSNPGVKNALDEAVSTKIISKLPDWKYSMVEWSWNDHVHPTVKMFLNRYGITGLKDDHGRDVINGSIIDLPAIEHHVGGVAMVEEVDGDRQ